MSSPDTYFARIGYAGPHTPTLDVLREICARHPAAIVFENIDPFLGRTPVLSSAALYEKLIVNGRGGYCFEQNALLRDVLRALGMMVTALAARVVWMAPPDAPARPRTHMLLKAEVTDMPGQSFIVDAGFGGQLFNVPLLLAPGLEQDTPTGPMRIVAEAGIHTVEALTPQGWSPLYRFSLDPCLPVDYEPLNWYTATHPSSIFRNNLLIQTVTSHGRTGLINDRLMTSTGQTRRIEDAQDYEAVLRQEFNLALPVPAGELFARIPKGFDGIVAPGSAKS